MELRELQYFLAVVREGNISRAAATLHVTQPTLSRQMAQLEHEVGARLFVRGRQLSLTEDGMLLRRRAEEIEHLMEKVQADLADRGRLSGTVSVGSGGLMAAQTLTQAIYAFRQENPGVAFELYTNSANHLKEHLDQGDLDFALLLEPVEADRVDCIRMPVRERWGVLMNVGNPLAARTAVAPEDLLDVPLALTDRLPLRRELGLWAGEAFAAYDVSTSFNLIDTVVVLVSHSLTCAVTTEGSTMNLDPRRFVFRRLSPDLSMTSVLAWKKSVPLSRAALQFLTFVKSYALSV